MIADIPTGALQVPDNALWMLGGWVLSVLISGWSGYRWGLASQIHAEKIKIKSAMLPLIEKFLIEGKKGELVELRYNSTNQIFPHAIALKNVLNGRRRKVFSDAWESFYNTKPEEVRAVQHGDPAGTEQKIRQLFISRLEPVKQIVEAS